MACGNTTEQLPQPPPEEEEYFTDISEEEELLTEVEETELPVLEEPLAVIETEEEEEEVEVEVKAEETELSAHEKYLDKIRLDKLDKLDKTLDNLFKTGKGEVDEIYYSVFIEYSDKELKYSEYHIRELSVKLKEPIADYFRTVDGTVPAANRERHYDDEDLEILLIKHKYIWFKLIDDLFIDKFYQYQDTAEYTPKVIKGLKGIIERKFNDLINDLM